MSNYELKKCVEIDGSRCTQLINLALMFYASIFFLFKTLFCSKTFVAPIPYNSMEWLKHYMVKVCLKNILKSQLINLS